MSTGAFESWTINPLELGPLYPFPGFEVLFTIILVAAWIGWHIWQFNFEKRELKRLKNKITNDGVDESWRKADITTDNIHDDNESAQM